VTRGEEDCNTTLSEEDEVVEDAEETYEEYEFGPDDKQQAGNLLDTRCYNELSVLSLISSVPIPQVVLRQHHHHFHPNQPGGAASQLPIVRESVSHILEKSMNYNQSWVQKCDSIERHGREDEVRSPCDESVYPIQQLDREQFQASRNGLRLPLQTLLEEIVSPLEERARETDWSYAWQPDHEEPMSPVKPVRHVIRPAFEPVHEELAYGQLPSQRVSITQTSHPQVNPPNSYGYTNAQESSNEHDAQEGLDSREKPTIEPMADAGGPMGYGQPVRKPMQKSQKKDKSTTKKIVANSKHNKAGLAGLFRKKKEDKLSRGNNGECWASNPWQDLCKHQQHGFGPFPASNKKEEFDMTRGNAISNYGQSSVALDSFVPGSSHPPAKAVLLHGNTINHHQPRPTCLMPSAANSSCQQENARSARDATRGNTPLISKGPVSLASSASPPKIMPRKPQTGIKSQNPPISSNLLSSGLSAGPLEAASWNLRATTSANSAAYTKNAVSPSAIPSEGSKSAPPMQLTSINISEWPNQKLLTPTNSQSLSLLQSSGISKHKQKEAPITTSLRPQAKILEPQTPTQTQPVAPTKSTQGASASSSAPVQALKTFRKHPVFRSARTSPSYQTPNHAPNMNTAQKENLQLTSRSKHSLLTSFFSSSSNLPKRAQLLASTAKGKQKQKRQHKQQQNDRTVPTKPSMGLTMLSRDGSRINGSEL